MNIITTMLTATALAAATATVTPAQAQDFIGKQQPTLKSDRLTPEALWAMGRVGGFKISPNGKQAVYAVTYYSVKQNKSHSVLYTFDIATRKSQQLTTSSKSEMGATFINGGKEIVFLSAESGSSQLWKMNVDGTNRQQISNTKSDIADFLFSPDGKKVILVMEVDQKPQHSKE